MIKYERKWKLLKFDCGTDEIKWNDSVICTYMRRRRKDLWENRSGHTYTTSQEPRSCLAKMRLWCGGACGRCLISFVIPLIIYAAARATTHRDEHLRCGNEKYRVHTVFY